MRTKLSPLAAAAALLLGCEGAWLSANQVASFRELPPAEAAALAAQPGAHVLQAGTARGGTVNGALLVEPGGDWPSEAGEEGPVVILAPDLDEGYRLAARMARSGIQDIAVVAGGLEAWRAHQRDGTQDPEEIAAARTRPRTQE